MDQLAFVREHFSTDAFPFLCIERPGIYCVTVVRNIYYVCLSAQT